MFKKLRHYHIIQGEEKKKISAWGGGGGEVQRKREHDLAISRKMATKEKGKGGKTEVFSFRRQRKKKRRFTRGKHPYVAAEEADAIFCFTEGIADCYFHTAGEKKGGGKSEKKISVWGGGRLVLV